ncbi:hypothetical protein C3942_21440 [Solimonas fluminis]|uniref:DUF2889 domain-containing protein n=1 Tax=Solimonas fluminis TaxID=2086571 RepID=A0A2S5TA62_9GAMM|nr:DUF2889 domain-containing protein [Solimonas fluminis]PPE71881.1 hypothetical protein C3942_21440 [Solimonas fluminis]
MSALDQLPGFRRRFRVTPGRGWVRSEVEDDYHHMTVILRHEAGVVTEVEPIMHRAPWTTCPGAPAQLRQTFTGVALEDFALRGEKTANCTHLHDLAVLAAAHAQDRAPLVYDILVSDPVEGRRRVELRRDGEPLLGWSDQDHRIVEPAELAGLGLFDQLRPWIDSLDPPRQEAARLLRWGAILAHGRVIPMERQSDASRMPPNCYSFQPPRKAQARRVGAIRDFSQGPAQPLDPYTPATAPAP